MYRIISRHLLSMLRERIGDGSDKCRQQYFSENSKNQRMATASLLVLIPAALRELNSETSRVILGDKALITRGTLAHHLSHIEDEPGFYRYLVEDFLPSYEAAINLQAENRTTEQKNTLKPKVDADRLENLSDINSHVEIFLGLITKLNHDISFDESLTMFICALRIYTYLSEQKIICGMSVKAKENRISFAHFFRELEVDWLSEGTSREAFQCRLNEHVLGNIKSCVRENELKELGKIIRNKIDKHVMCTNSYQVLSYYKHLDNENQPPLVNDAKCSLAELVSRDFLKVTEIDLEKLNNIFEKGKPIAIAFDFYDIIYPKAVNLDLCEKFVIMTHLHKMVQNLEDSLKELYPALSLEYIIKSNPQLYWDVLEECYKKAKERFRPKALIKYNFYYFALQIDRPCEYVQHLGRALPDVLKQYVNKYMYNQLVENSLFVRLTDRSNKLPYIIALYDRLCELLANDDALFIDRYINAIKYIFKNLNRELLIKFHKLTLSVLLSQPKTEEVLDQYLALVQENAPNILATQWCCDMVGGDVSVLGMSIYDISPSHLAILLKFEGLYSSKELRKYNMRDTLSAYKASPLFFLASSYRGSGIEVSVGSQEQKRLFKEKISYMLSNELLRRPINCFLCANEYNVKKHTPLSWLLKCFSLECNNAVPDEFIELWEMMYEVYLAHPDVELVIYDSHGILENRQPLLLSALTIRLNTFKDILNAIVQRNPHGLLEVLMLTAPKKEVPAITQFKKFLDTNKTASHADLAYKLMQQPIKKIQLTLILQYAKKHILYGLNNIEVQTDNKKFQRLQEKRDYFSNSFTAEVLKNIEGAASSQSSQIISNHAQHVNSEAGRMDNKQFEGNNAAPYEVTVTTTTTHAVLVAAATSTAAAQREGRGIRVADQELGAPEDLNFLSL